MTSFEILSQLVRARSEATVAQGLLSQLQSKLPLAQKTADMAERSLRSLTLYYLDMLAAEAKEDPLMTPGKLREMAEWFDKKGVPSEDQRAVIRVLREEADWMEAHPDA